MSISTVLVAGATGNLGFKTILALLDSKKFKEVRALVRPATLQGDQKKDKVEQLKAKGAIIKEGDVNDVNSLISALQGVDAVISTVTSNDFVKSQLNLLEASKAAGVKRFIPGEFGVDDEAKTSKVLLHEWKIKVLEAVEKSGLEWTVIVNGVFLEYLFFSPFAGIDIKAGTATIAGDGTQKVATTDVGDIAKAIPYILLNPATKNARVRIVGDRLTPLEVVDLIERLTGKKITKTFVPVKELVNQINSNENRFATLFQQFAVLIASGKGDIPVNNNKDYPEVKFTTAEEFLKKALSAQQQ